MGSRDAPYHQPPIAAPRVVAVSDLYLAAECGDLATVDAILRRSPYGAADINDRGGADGGTPLTAATLNGHAAVVRLLLAAGADPTAATVDGYTALHLAAQAGDVGAVVDLLRAGARLDARSHDGGHTPLLLAAYDDRVDVIPILIDGGSADGSASTGVNVAADDGTTPLHVATGRGDVELVDALLRRGADADAHAVDRQTPLHVAASAGWRDVAATLLDVGRANTDAKTVGGETPLHLAARYDHPDVVDLLVGRGVAVNATMTVRTEYVSSTSNRTTEVVQEEDHGWTALHHAAFWGHVNVVRLLIAARADVQLATSNGRSALYAAAENGHADTVAELLRAGAYVNQETADGAIPLTAAATNGHERVVELLLQYESDVNHVTRDGTGSTPLSAATRNGHELVAERLRSAGALQHHGGSVQVQLLPQPHVVTHQVVHEEVRVTPPPSAIVVHHTAAGPRELHAAVDEGNVRLVEDLLARGADVNAQASGSVTCLHTAATRGNEDMV